MTDTPTRPRPAKVYTMADLQPIIDGKLPVPNFEEMTPDEGLRALAFHGEGGIRGQVRLDMHDFNAEWGCYFLTREGMGSLGGNGIVVWDHAIHLPKYKQVGRIAKFAICVHSKVEGAGANHSRGWHPGFCSKCGMDLSVDSGD